MWNQNPFYGFKVFLYLTPFLFSARYVPNFDFWADLILRFLSGSCRSGLESPRDGWDDSRIRTLSGSANVLAREQAGTDPESLLRIF
jgi:hypothetical protein